MNEKLHNYHKRIYIPD